MHLKKEGIDLAIRHIERKDLLSVAKLHKEIYENYHFTSRFTIPMLVDFYEEIISQNKFCYLAETDNKIVGVVLAGNKTKDSVKSYVRKYWYKLIYILILNPYFLKFKWIDFFALFLKADRKSSPTGVRFLSLLVDTNYQGKGIALKLTQKLENDLLLDNINGYGLSVKKQNTRTIHFHLKNNCKVEFQNARTIYFTKTLF